MEHSAKDHPATPRRRLPAWLNAALAQSAAWLLVIALIVAQWLPASPAYVLGAQAVGAAAIAMLLRCERWWLLIHLGFSPLLALALSLGADPRWYLGVFVLLLLVFWGTLGTRVPLYLSGRAAVGAVATLLPEKRPLRMLDLGSGIGTLLVPLAQNHPDCDFTGIESAPAPWLVSRLRRRGKPNLHFERGDFFAADWSTYDVVYAFLSPHPMTAVWRKAQGEMTPHSLLISKDFPVAGILPSSVLSLPDGSTLYCYRPDTAD